MAPAPTKTIFYVPGLDCPAEEKLIRKAFETLPEVNELAFNLIDQEVAILHSYPEITPLHRVFKSIGMPATLKEVSSSLSTASLTASEKPHWPTVFIAFLFALAAEMMGYTTGETFSPGVILSTLLAIGISGKPTIQKGWIAVRTRTLNIYFLMMVAVTGALAIGALPEAAMVTVLFAVAEKIERYSLDKARKAIRHLMEIVPEQATVKTPEGNWESQSVSQITIGTIIWVKPGARIPLDGIILKGQSSVNQAPITGESLSVLKQIGDTVYAGSINESGTFEFQVTAPPTDTVLAKIILSIQKAHSEKAPTQRFVDTFCRYYTPCMVGLAVCVATIPPLVWGTQFYPWMYKALTLLVIACPCALVLSTPITVVSGLTAGARKGLLIKGGVYLENGFRVTMMAFDKTGTLTEGKPTVTQTILLTEDGPQDPLHIAASISHHSEHPIAHALVSYWKETHPTALFLPVTAFEAIPGRGAVGEIDGIRYYVGNHTLAEENRVCHPQLETLLDTLEEQSFTTVIVSDTEKALAVVAVSDTLRPQSQAAIQALHALGITTCMLTGDNLRTATAIAQQVGIEKIEANILPTEKLQAISLLLEKEKYVGMVGDGINDAPALAKATIGFAMGKGTATALETADVALMDNNLGKLADFILLSRKTSQVLKQNITISILTKGVFFGLALAGLSTLWMAVFADMGASLLVVGNGLRLLKTAK